MDLPDGGQSPKSLILSYRVTLSVNVYPKDQTMYHISDIILKRAAIFFTSTKVMFLPAFVCGFVGLCAFL